MNDFQQSIDQMNAAILKSMGVPPSVLAGGANYSCSKVATEAAVNQFNAIVADQIDGMREELTRRMMWNLGLGERDRMLDYLEAITQCREGREDRSLCGL